MSIFMKYLFDIYGKWSVQASKQASIDTHTHMRNAVMLVWVGLTQARPNCLWFDVL